jgi:hypothetical protein
MDAFPDAASGSKITQEHSPSQFFGIDTSLLKHDKGKLSRHQIKSSRTELFFSSNKAFIE